MQLTTLARVKTLSPLSANSTQHDALLNSQIAAVSKRIEAYLNRNVAIELRSEDYFVDKYATLFTLRTAPVYSTDTSPIVVASAPSLKISWGRDFTVDAEDVANYYFRMQDGVVEFDFPTNLYNFRWNGALRASYYGGMAYTLDQLVASSTSHVGTVLNVGDAVVGSLSGATGTVLAITSDTSITVKVLSGSFEVGEHFALASDTTRYATFTALSASGMPLCMSYPELVEACNMQVSWLFQNRERQGYNTMSVEGATISMEKSGTLMKGTKEMVEHLVRYGVTY